MIRRAKAVCNRPRSRALYTSARAGNYNCRQQGILIVANPVFLPGYVHEGRHQIPENHSQEDARHRTDGEARDRGRGPVRSPRSPPSHARRGGMAAPPSGIRQPETQIPQGDRQDGERENGKEENDGDHEPDISQVRGRHMRPR